MSTLTQKQERYEAYLRSATWRKKRHEVMDRDDHCCQKCGSGWDLQVHHLTYRNLFDEPLEDLVTWCKSCHVAYHGPAKVFNRKTARGELKPVTTYVDKTRAEEIIARAKAKSGLSEFKRKPAYKLRRRRRG